MHAMALQLLMILAFLVAALILLKLHSAIYNYLRTLYASRRLPGFPTHWLWGNAHQIGENGSIHKWYVNNLAMVQSGRHKITRRWIGPFIMELEINHPELFKNILKEPKDKSVYRMLQPWLGDGLLVSSGKKWARNRHLLTPGFHYEILKSYIPVYNSCMDVLCVKWEKMTRNKEPVKLFHDISMLSLDIIIQCAFSHKSNCQDMTAQPYIQSVLTLLEMITDRYLQPLHQIDWYYWKTPTGQKMKHLCATVHQFSENVISERKRMLGLDKETKNRDAALSNAKRKHKYLDFVDILLTAEDENGEGLTDLEIRDEVDTFMFEGHDTTTSGICWTLYALAKHPEHQEKVREEVRAVLQGREWLEHDDFIDLKYTQWCIKESMRLHPPVTDIFRILSEDKEFEGIVVPKGTRVCVKMFPYHRHPDIWENPNEFDPLRFSPENTEDRDPFAYIPFSAGPRNCIGQNFALNEEKVVVARIINQFKLSIDPNQDLIYHPIGTLKVKKDIKLILEPLGR